MKNVRIFLISALFVPLIIIGMETDSPESKKHAMLLNITEQDICHIDKCESASGDVTYGACLANGDFLSATKYAGGHIVCERFCEEDHRLGMQNRIRVGSNVFFMLKKLIEQRSGHAYQSN